MNDDVFFVKQRKLEDFIQNEICVDEGTLNGINGKDEVFAGMQFQNMLLINRH